MSVTKDSLKAKYKELPSDELLRLKEEGGLTELARDVLNQELSERNIKPEEQATPNVPLHTLASKKGAKPSGCIKCGCLNFEYDHYYSEYSCENCGWTVDEKPDGNIRMFNRVGSARKEGANEKPVAISSERKQSILESKKDLHSFVSENKDREETASEFIGSCPALIESAHPEVYRHNAFRVMGLSVEETQRNMLRHTEKLRMMQKYGAKEAQKTPLALNPPPDEHTIREALHKLHDPEKRLIDEFFWFWPHQIGQSKTDQALALLARNDINHAAKRWFQMEQSSESFVSMHNLAVLFHCLALDWEHVALSRQLNEKELGTVRQYWGHAFNRWKVVLDHEPFWSRLTARIRALEDPRLTTGFARRMRASLPFALLSINATLAVRYAEAGNIEAAERQVENMRLWEASGDAKESRDDPDAEIIDLVDESEASGNGQDTREIKPKGFKKGRQPPLPVLGPIAQKVLREALEPIRQRIKSICKNSEKQVNDDPIHGDTAVREVIEHTKPLLAILDGLLPPGDATRDASHDQVAECALHCQISYGNETENWKISLELLEMAFPIAAGQPVRDRIEQNINTVKTNLEYDTCWFCSQNPAEDTAALDVKMYGEVTRTRTVRGVETRWRHGTVKVPRCAQCGSVHDRIGVFKLGYTASCLLLGVGVIVLLSNQPRMWSRDLFVGCLLAGIGLVVFGVIILKILYRQKGVRPESTKVEFPSVKKLRSQGWIFGDRPATQ